MTEGLSEKITEIISLMEEMERKESEFHATHYKDRTRLSSLFIQLKIDLGSYTFTEES